MMIHKSDLKFQEQIFQEIKKSQIKIISWT